MQEFAVTYSFHHITSSSHYPQSNGLAERTVKTVKELLSHSSDPSMALLSYRDTALPWCNLRPAELLMGCKIRTDVPQLSTEFVPEWPYLHAFREKDAILKQKQKSNYDRSHRTRSQHPLDTGTAVWIRTGNTSTPGRVITTANTPRSYLNCVHAVWSSAPKQTPPHLPQDFNGDISGTNPTTETTVSMPGRQQIMNHSRTGTEIPSPERLTY